MLRQDEQVAWTEWLRSMRWDWFVTCAFGGETSGGAALRAVTDWLSPLRRSYAAVGVQRGPAGDRLHVHALVGGTGRHPLVESRMRWSWRRGSIDLKGYSPLKGGVEYLCAQAHEIVIVGAPLQQFRARR